MCTRVRKLRSHAPIGVALAESEGNVARAPWMIILRRYTLPRFVMPELPRLATGGHLLGSSEPGVEIAAALEILTVTDRGS